MMKARSRSGVIIFSESLRHDYVRRLFEEFQSAYLVNSPQPWTSNKGKILRLGSDAVIHIQWIDLYVRQSSYMRAVAVVFKAILFLLIARLAGVGIVWTLHNPVGKGHKRVNLDRIARALLLLVADRIVVLNASVVPAAKEEFPGFLHRKLVGKTRQVPMPFPLRDHGAKLSRLEARQILGIEPHAQLVTYVPGANQEDLHLSLSDPLKRYELLMVQRESPNRGEVCRTKFGWTFNGRPSDVEFGLLLQAGNAVVLGEKVAYASMTVSACVDLEVPVISVPNPSVTELALLRGAVLVESRLSPDSIAQALLALPGLDMSIAREEYERAHTGTLVSNALNQVYQEVLT